MIYVGIDDTDMPDTPGTNQLARRLAAAVVSRCPCRWIVRHQLLADPRVPCTSKNGSASLTLEPHGEVAIDWLAEVVRDEMRRWFIAGSDPGFCLAREVPDEVRSFGRHCQQELVAQAEARALAQRHNILLEGLGGTEGGVIGALAAVGLAVDGDDGRIVQIGAWPDDLSGPQDARTLAARGVEVRQLGNGQPIEAALIDVGKHLRPNCRAGRAVLFVEPQADETGSPAWRAVRLP